MYSIDDSPSKFHGYCHFLLCLQGQDRGSPSAGAVKSNGATTVSNLDTACDRDSSAIPNVPVESEASPTLVKGSSLNTGSEICQEKRSHEEDSLQPAKRLALGMLH